MRNRGSGNSGLLEWFSGRGLGWVTGRARNADMEKEGLGNAQRTTSLPGHSLPSLGLSCSVSKANSWIKWALNSPPALSASFRGATVISPRDTKSIACALICGGCGSSSPSGGKEPKYVPRTTFTSHRGQADLSKVERNRDLEWRIDCWVKEQLK